MNESIEENWLINYGLNYWLNSCRIHDSFYWVYFYQLKINYRIIKKWLNVKWVESIWKISLCLSDTIKWRDNEFMLFVNNEWIESFDWKISDQIMKYRSIIFLKLKTWLDKKWRRVSKRLW